MQDIEAAVGETDAQALLSPILELRVEFAARRHDLFFGREKSMRQDLAPQFRRRDNGRALLADRDGGCRIRHSQRALPIGPCRQYHREHRGNGVAGARDVAHLDRMGGNMNGVALARHQRHAVLALRHQHGLAIGQLHDVLRRIGDIFLGVGAAAGGFGEFLAIGRQQGRAAIDRKIRALGIDDHPLAELSRGVDDVANDTRGQHALGVVGQQHDIGARQAWQDAVEQFLLDLGGGRFGQFPVRAQHMGGEMLGNETHLARGRPRSVADQHAFNAAFLRKLSLQLATRLVLADQSDEDAACSDRSDVARHIAGAADIGLAALDRDHRRRCFR